MISFRDKTFCGSHCTNRDCDKYFSTNLSKEATEIGLPVTYSNMSFNCKDYEICEGFVCSICGHYMNTNDYNIDKDRVCPNCGERVFLTYEPKILYPNKRK